IAALGQTGGPGEHLRHHHAGLDALHQEGAEIAMQRTDRILAPQPVAGADDDRFLTDAGINAAAHLALSDQDAEPLVEPADQLQPVEHLEQLFRSELELRALDWGHRTYRITKSKEVQSGSH